MDLTPDPKAAKLLRDALELMNDAGRHWTRRSFKRTLDDGSLAYCALGALRTAAFGDTVLYGVESSGTPARRYVKAVNVLTTVIGKHLDDNNASPSGTGSGVVDWNDEECDSFEDVRAGFEAAIAKLGG
jgi:hypothetical protein